ncbi:Pentachlorophenol 4-monooxygenase [Corynebacterium occultum]|uniref:Pentachlorophenol 4-monooxygenase n=1 Tax=Corynebacterium occultum TaxID=2675219 RepID=A0A6B8WFC6_9CORY|nr:FAD-dependent monooxygenase [Corynebacterium occultum]QGU08680.1 Pentachlorophenol 4-monooxygenase [Corynebacterium occultum]
MQFHHHGYVSQDPKQAPAAGIGLNRPTELPDTMDVLIVGTGPAGMITAAQMSMFPDVHTRIIERRDHRLQLGQADGIQSRSNETFQAFRFATEIIEEAYHLTEMAFWNQDPENPGNIIRGARPIDDEHGISEFPHTIVNQARVLDYFARFMKWSPSRMTPDYGWEFLSLRISEDPADAEYPVFVELKRITEGEGEYTRTVRTKHVVGSDGARSRVRDSIDRKLEGKQANHAWGVMDVLVDSDFPDIRTKCAIHSRSGSILHIPREGGYLSRMYIDLGEVPADDNHKVRSTPLETVIQKANDILHPYFLDVKDVAWHSVYEVGHRLVDGFDDLPADAPEDAVPRIFLTGDACHTHSAKAGQGMNVSMQDGFNIGWKLGQVLSGVAPTSLLRTYHGERHPAAAALIAFDKEWSTLMATPVDQLEDPEAVEKFYVEAEEFAAGFLTQYSDNIITAGTEHQDLATGYPVGRRFKSHPAMRRCDAVATHIGHEHVADGRWRIYAFADQPAPAEQSRLREWAEWMDQDPESPLNRFTPTEGDRNARFDIKAIYQQHYHDFELFDAPELFFPRVGPFQLQNWENVWSSLKEDDYFEARGISRDGAIIVVRPDQHVAAVLPLDDTAALAEFFAQNLLEPAQVATTAN